MYFPTEELVPVSTSSKLLCAALVTLMQLGFACLEAGLVDSRNTLSILYKNTLDFCFGFLTFVFVWTTFFHAPFSKPADVADLLYNGTFATTAATICSGALAGRIRLTAYIWLSMFMTGLIYPCVSWKLFHEYAPAVIGGKSGQYYDLAGAVAVHAVGGWAALAAAFYVGPKRGFHQADRIRSAISVSDNSESVSDNSESNERESDITPTSKPILIKPHNLPLASIGMFLLVVGWYGFNMGSSPTESDMSIIALHTILSGAAGGCAAFVYGRCSHTPSLSLIINGILGGLVAVTSCANIIQSWQAAMLGGLAGIVVCLWLNFLRGNPKRLENFEDPVGAFPVHGLCGLLGGLAVIVIGKQKIQINGSSVTLFDEGWQLGLTIAAPLLTGLAVSLFLIAYDAIAKSIPRDTIRKVVASPEEQGLGLDIAEFVEHAYDFGERSDKPEDLFEQLQILMSRFDVSKITFDNCATHQRGQQQKSNQPFKLKFAYWIEEISRLASRYSEAFGEYAPGAHGSAKSICERISRTKLQLSLYMQLPEKDRKEHFQDKATELTDSINTLNDMLRLHVEQRRGGRQVIESTAQELQELKKDLTLLEGKLKAFQDNR